MEPAADLVAGGVALDLAILDFRMPGMNGSAGIETFYARFSDTPVVVLSGNYQRQDVLECFRRGASGFIPKGLGTKATTNAIRFVLEGGKFLPADILPDHLEADRPRHDGVGGLGRRAASRFSTKTCSISHSGRNGGDDFVATSDVVDAIEAKLRGH